MDTSHRDQILWEEIVEDELEFQECLAQLVEGGAQEIAEDLERRRHEAMEASYAPRRVDPPSG